MENCLKRPLFARRIRSSASFIFHFAKQQKIKIHFYEASERIFFLKLCYAHNVKSSVLFYFPLTSTKMVTAYEKDMRMNVFASAETKEDTTMMLSNVPRVPHNDEAFYSFSRQVCNAR